MEASIVDLRYRMKSVLEALDRGESVTVLHRGKPRARLEPIQSKAKAKPRMKVEDHPAFGMWKDRKDMEDVEAYLKHLRRPRYDRDGNRNP
jgi:antitoxin (DNA-binding transcriptional repressor) of toxin-antitoxin stability system